MKMKQKGITTIVIVVIVIIVVAVAAAGTYLLTRGEEEGVAALGITTTSLPDGVVGVAYSAALVASGGTSPYAWSIVSGSLPGELSLSTAGVISGTPTTEGTWTFTVQVTDSVENTATKALSIHVGAAGGYTGTGAESYSGNWSGFCYGGTCSGTWGFTVNWDAGTVSGWFTGTAAGDVAGSVSPGVISASGTALGGTVTWSGNFSADGSTVTGNWECPIAGASGTFSGTRKST